MHRHQRMLSEGRHRWRRRTSQAGAVWCTARFPILIATSLILISLVSVGCESLTFISYGCILPLSETDSPVVVIGLVNGGANVLSGALLYATDANGATRNTTLPGIQPGTELKHTLTVGFNRARSVSLVNFSVGILGAAVPLISEQILCAWRDTGGVATLRAEVLNPGKGSHWEAAGIMAVILSALLFISGIVVPVWFAVRDRAVTNAPVGPTVYGAPARMAQQPWAKTGIERSLDVMLQSRDRSRRFR